MRLTDIHSVWSGILPQAGVSEWQTRQTQNLLWATTCGFKSRCRQFLQVLNSFGNKGFGIFYVLIVLITFDYLFILQLYATLLFPYLHLRLLYSYNPYLKHHKYNCYYLPFLYVLKWKMQQLLIPLHFSIWN